MSKRLMNPGLALQSLWFATCLPQKNLRSDWLIKLKLSITNLNLCDMQQYAGIQRLLGKPIQMVTSKKHMLSNLQWPTTHCGGL